MVNPKELESIGFIDFGNNQLFEVMVKQNQVVEDKDFVHDSFPVWLLSHDAADPDDLEEYEDITTFITQVAKEQPHHLNAVIIQLGEILGNKSNA